MKFMQRIVGNALVLVFLLMLSISAVQAQDNAQVRFVHVVPDTAPIDVYINGTLAATDIAYGDASTYINVPAGTHTVSATLLGSANPLWEQSFTIDASSAATFIASSGTQFDRFNDNLTISNFGNTRLLLVHALAGGPAVDVQLAQPVELNGVEQVAGTVIAQNMAYANSFGAFDLPANNYVVNVVPNGAVLDPVLSNVILPLRSGTSNMAVVYGTGETPNALLLSTGIPATDAGLVRFVHGVAGGPAVNITLDDTLVVPNLTPDSPTEHVAIPAGTYTASVQANGQEVASGSLTVEAGVAQTVVAITAGDAISLAVNSDDVGIVNNEQAVLKLFNTVPDSSVSVTLADGTQLIADLAGGETATAISIPPSKSSLDFTLTIGDQTGTITSDEFVFSGGVYYNVIVEGGSVFTGPELNVIPTSINRDLASAPGVGQATLATGSDTTTPSQTSVQPTPPPNSEVVQATPPPPQQQAPRDPVVQQDDTVTARVQLDPSANLQLRQYPDRDALSLGLAPSGTVLEVNGREGRPVALVEGEDPPPEAATYVDPATQLVDENDDLEPEQTWLNVTYFTPDGGEIVAWVLSQYLVVTDDDGDLQRLADLPTIGRNIPGEAQNTDVTPPPLPEDVVRAEVFNLNPDVSLNMRRNPTTNAEVLERLPSGTVMELVGFLANDSFDPEASEWAYVEYLPAGGGSITGWVSTTYVQYSWSNRDIDPTELLERDLVDFVDADVIGRVTGGAQQASIPTPDPQRDAYVAEVNLNPGANLQFRIASDASSESLNLIPSGTRLIVDGRNSAGDWLRTTFEGEQGWIAADFVVVSFNGRFVEIDEIPVLTTAEN